MDPTACIDVKYSTPKSFIRIPHKFIEPSEHLVVPFETEKRSVEHLLFKQKLPGHTCFHGSEPNGFHSER